MQTQAFFTMGVAAALLGERPTKRSLLGASLAGLGIALLAVGRGAGQATVPFVSLVLILASALSWAAGNLLLRRIGKGALIRDKYLISQ
jgi:O-acetylserine/cysteine efflux transporter